MTDALQVLSTKIKLSAPYEMRNPIIIGDTAAIDDVTISPYRILRGGDSLYEKYGYQSPSLAEIKEYIRTKTWGDFLAHDELSEIVGTYRRYKALAPIFDVDEATPITDVFKNITFEHEKKYAGVYDAPISSIFFDTLSAILFGEGVSPLLLTLDEKSKNWKHMKNVVTILGVEQIAGGGSRRRSKTRRRVSKNKK